MTSYCPFCGKVARWPKTAPEACSLRCAADTAIGYVEVGGDWDAAPYCTGCGDEVTPGHDCPRCSAEPKEVTTCCPECATGTSLNETGTRCWNCEPEEETA